MIAKGLDFENVTLVGIISADTGLYLPDFRASERTFQLISQVAGRAGRRKISGEVVVQSFAPGNLPIQGVGEEEQEKFYKKIMKERKLQSYPPIGKLILFESSSESKELARNGAKLIHSTLKSISNSTELFGPAPAVIEKIRKRYRWRVMILLSGIGNKRLQEIKLKLRNMTKVIRKKMRKDLRLGVDVDPSLQGNSFEEMAGQVWQQVSHHLHSEGSVYHCVTPTPEIHRHHGKCLVQRHHHVRHADYPLPVT